jgi:hypothetical protein
VADKTKSIKESNDKELDALILRLRRENEAQDLISQLKRKSLPLGMVSYDNPQVSTEEPVDSLYHFGILGMHWGQHRSSSKSSKRSSGSEDNTSADHKRKMSLKKKKVSEMSNDELRDLTTRLQLERQYKDLRKQDVSTGRKFVQDLLLDVGKDIVKSSVKSSMNSLIKKIK